jgi:hypothetical protein
MSGNTTWEIEESDYGDELWFGGEGCGLIQVNGWSNGGCKDIPAEWMDLQRQARLIAAAPELLAAAKLVIAWYEAEDDHSKADFYERLQMCRDSEDALRGAIAKAEGATP